MKGCLKFIIAMIIGIIAIVVLSSIYFNNPEQKQTINGDNVYSVKTQNANKIYEKMLTDYQNENYESALNGYYTYTSKYSDVEISGDIEALKTEIENAIPRIPAHQIISEYQNNEVKADEMYRGKLIIVTGTIDSIGKDILDLTYITIGDGSKYSVEDVQCYFRDEEEIAKIAELSTGNKITIQGRCEGKTLLNVMLKNCVVK